MKPAVGGHQIVYRPTGHLLTLPHVLIGVGGFLVVLGAICVLVCLAYKPSKKNLVGGPSRLSHTGLTAAREARQMRRAADIEEESS